ncbi:MAG: hypothetical protein AB8H80_01715 [Planctomycetota bacterium]
MLREPSPKIHLLAAALGLLAATSPALAQAGGKSKQAPAEAGPYETARQRYDEVMPRKVFAHHVDGRDKLAQSQDPAALEQLARDYSEVKAYPEHARYTMATQIGRNFREDKFLAPLQRLRQKHDDLLDTWLWVEVLGAEIRSSSTDHVVEIALTAKKTHLRAAAIAALGAEGRGELKQAIVANCVEFPRKAADRMVLLGAMTGALYNNKDRVNDEDYREALKAYISLLAKDVKLTKLAKLQMARHLQPILNAPAKFTDPEPWLELLKRGEVKKPKDYGTSSKPSFFGIETEGERFVYVLDMSDSMLKEISPSARPKGPITGPRKKPKKKKSMVLNEGDLPWHKIRTRWDLAREQLRISLSRLSSDKHFSIVWFGTEAGTLNATKGLVKATKSNVKKAMAELDSINSGSGDGEDLLRGKTSLHYGLAVAFGLTKRGVAAEPAYVGAKPLTEGCDTIFLLSDGAPNWDGFDVSDKDYGEGRVMKDIENGIEAQRTPRVTYHGPYAAFPTIRGGPARPEHVDCWMLRDVERMNAFRRIRMHCVGLGEANELLLKCLARLGNGDVFIVGKKK